MFFMQIFFIIVFIFTVVNIQKLKAAFSLSSILRKSSLFLKKKKKKYIYRYIDIHMQIVFIYGSYMYSLLFKMSDHCPRGELNFIYVRTFI